MLNILQARLQQYMNHELPDVQAGLEKAEEHDIKLWISTGSSEKQENSRKTSTFPYCLRQSLWLYVSQQTVLPYKKRLIKQIEHLLTCIIHVYMGDNKEKVSNSQMWLKIDLNLFFGKRQREKDVKGVSYRELIRKSMIMKNKRKVCYVI